MSPTTDLGINAARRDSRSRNAQHRVAVAVAGPRLSDETEPGVLCARVVRSAHGAVGHLRPHTSHMLIADAPAEDLPGL